MGGMSIGHWIIVGIIVLLLFGRGKISDLMGDVAKGIKAFKKGIAEEPTATAATDAAKPLPAQDASQTAAPAQPVSPPKTGA